MLAALASCAISAAPASWDSPVLRVSTEQHTDAIKKLDTDLAGERVLSVSDDKTAKLWDSRTGRLLKTFRVPIDDRLEGQLFVGALHPGGRFAAVGGFTTDSTNQIPTYFFVNTEVGGIVAQMNATAGDPAWVVHNLLFSPSGRYFAAALGGGATGFYALRLYDVSGREPVLLQDHRSFNAPIHGIDFSKRDHLAVVALDGALFEFSPDDSFAVAKSRGLSVAERPMHVRYSPDGDRMAVGYDGAPTVEVIESGSLTTKHIVDQSLFPGQVGLHALDWSSDARYIFAAGESADSNASRLYRWKVDGSATPEPINIATNRVTDVHRLPDGNLVVSSSDPSITCINVDGEIIWEKRTDVVDHRYAFENFRLSADGAAVQFAFSRDELALGEFDTTRAEEEALRVVTQRSTEFSPSLKRSSSWSVIYTPKKSSLNINDQPVTLERLETVQTHAIDAQGQLACVGTSWAIRCYSQDGSERAQLRFVLAGVSARDFKQQ